MSLDQILRLVVSGLSLGSFYALVALSFVMMLLVSDLLNFALGEILMLAAFIALLLVTSGLPWLVALIAATIVAGVIGLAMERLAFRPLWAQNAPPINVVMASVALSIFLANLALRLFGAVPRAFPPALGDEVREVGPLRFVPQELIVIGVAVVAMVALQIFFRRTTAGIALRAVMLDRDAASLMGIDVGRSIALTFAISAALGGAAGVLLAPFLSVSWGMGGIAMKGIAAATLGGIYSVPGAIVGGFLLGWLETGITFFVTSTFRDALVYTLMILILLFRPEGIMGRR